MKSNVEDVDLIVIDSLYCTDILICSQVTYGKGVTIESYKRFFFFLLQNTFLTNFLVLNGKTYFNQKLRIKYKKVL